MADDIIARLRLSGEQFAKDTKALFAGVPAAAEQAGLAAGQSLAKGVKGGTGEIAAAVGQATQSVSSYERQIARTAPLIDRFAAEQAAAAAQVAAARAAYKAGEATLEQYNAEVLRSKVVTSAARAEYNLAVNELNEVARATALLNQQQRGNVVMSGQQKAGMQQLSFQISDVGAQVASMGLSVENVTRTIAVQSSQFVQAITMMRGSAGGFIGFLGGPWGAAIMAGVSVLAMLGAEALKAGDDMDQAAKSAERLKEALANLGSLKFTGQDATEIMKEVQKLNAAAAAAERQAAFASGGLGGASGARYFQQQAEEARRKADALLNDLRTRSDPATNPALRIAQRNQSILDRPADRPDRGSRGLSDAEKAARELAREREQAAEAAKRAEEGFEESIQRTLQAQQDSFRVEQMRAEQGEVAAAGEQARLSFLQQQPLAVHRTVEELAKALGITEALNDAERERLQNLINAADAAESQAVRVAEEAERKSVAEAQRSKEEARFRELQRQSEEAGRLWEDQVRDVADLYEDLFTGGTDRVWKNFRREGLRIVAEIAAQWTLATISGQSRGSIGDIAGDVLSRSPLGSLFGVVGGSGRVGTAAANDNMILKGAGGIAGLPKSWAGVSGTGGLAEGEPGKIVVTGQQAGSLLDQAGISIAVASIANAIGIGGSGTGANIGGMIGSAGGMAIGGPIGAAIGSMIGNVLGGLAEDLIGSTKRGSAIIGSTGAGLGVTGYYGNSSSRKDAAGQLGGSLIDSINQIAEALGATVNPSRGKVSIGMREGSLYVDPQGRGYTKTSKYRDIQGFGQDEEAAVRFAIADLLKDGVLGGISDASLAILRSGQDLEAAIEKAVLIESVPKLLKQRLDPLGAALDEIDAKFRELADALKEGGAGADQIAQARQLWQLEREDAIKQIGDASAGLKEFLSSLMAGSNSPLSLRQQRAEAEAAFKPYADAIGKARDARSEADRLKAAGASASEIAAAETAARTAAQSIDQQGFQQAAQLLLGIDRSMNASSDSFFATFDRIRSLTSGGIVALDSATTSPSANDPFAQLVAKNTGDTANMLADTNRLLQSINDNLLGGGSGSGYSWMAEKRQFA